VPAAEDGAKEPDQAGIVELAARASFFTARLQELEPVEDEDRVGARREAAEHAVDALDAGRVDVEPRREIEATERRGYEAAPITTSRGFVMRPDIRNNTRVMVDDAELAARLWARAVERASALLQPSGNDGPRFDPVGLNERFRFYRYAPGQTFRWHFDGAFVRSPTERSFLTFMIYLNGGFVGGETEFEDEVVVPKPGLALVFDHGLHHQGAEVHDGCKYVLRSDVMFAR